MKTAFHLFVLVLLLISCQSSNKLNKFIGKWKRVDLKSAAYIEIKKDGDAIIALEVKTQGEKKYVASFDKDNNVLVVDVVLGKVNISYLDSKDRILISGQGEYERIP